MTVGIYITNGKSAVAIADSRRSGSGRQSDSVNKLTDFSRENYFGVIFGSGLANFLEAISKGQDSIKADYLEGFVTEVFKLHKSQVDSYDTKMITGYKTEAAKKAELIDNPDEKTRFIQGEIGRIMQKYDEAKQQNSTAAVIVGYDKESQKYRAFHTTCYVYDEVHLPHIEIGSGSDGSNMYLTQKLQGVDLTKISDAEMLFEAVNAYCTSTVNQGVGGTPKIAHLTKDGCRVLAPKETITMVNLSGIYLSGNKELDRDTVRRCFEMMMQNSFDYVQAAETLDLAGSTLTNVCIPLSSWQEAENRKNQSRIDF